MSFARSHNIGGWIDTARAVDSLTWTAGGSGDNTAITGQVTDRTALGAGGKATALSASITISWKAVQAISNTLTLKSIKLQHGSLANGSDMADLFNSGNTSSFADVVVDTGSGGTDRGRLKLDVDLASAKQYIRLVFTPDLSAANTDTGQVEAQFVFGGDDILP